MPVANQVTGMPQPFGLVALPRICMMVGTDVTLWAAGQASHAASPAGVLQRRVCDGMQQWQPGTDSTLVNLT